MRQNKRLILPGFLSHDACKELEFIQKSCSTVGYRPHVFSTTLAHLIATNCGYLIMPFVPIRERLKEKMEEFFGCEYELSIEFTGLISWTKGASIGWHSDDNRPYLKQRHYTAVCYLNNYGEDFKGGLFHFQEGEPTTIVPKIGDAILYTADECNIHCVDEITDGERCTLTLWFTRDSSHNEDVKLINQLSDRLCRYTTRAGHFDSDLTLVHGGEEIPNVDSHLKTAEDKFVSDSIPGDWLPLSASSNMYWVNPENSRSEEAFADFGNSALQQHLGFDIRWARISLLGFEFCFDKSHSIEYETSVQTTNYNYTLYITEALQQPLRLKWKGIDLPKQFTNSLHALQVVLFHQWKVLNRSGPCVDRGCRHGSAVMAVGAASARHQESQIEENKFSKQLSLQMLGMPNNEHDTYGMSHSMSSFENELQFNCEDFIQIVRDWEHYVWALWRALLLSLPYWKANAIIFPVPT